MYWDIFKYKMCLQLRYKMSARFVSCVFLFPQKLHDPFYISKELTNLKGIYMYPLKR